MGLFMASCSSPKEKTIEALKDATEQIKEAKGDGNKIKEISVKTSIELVNICDGMSEEEMKALNDDPEVKKATEEYTAALGEFAEKKVEDALTGSDE